MRTKSQQLLEELQNQIHSEWIKERFRIEPRYFTRDRVFTFSVVVLMHLNILSRSLSVEIHKFLKLCKFPKIGSKQAFSKACSHLKWEAFEYFNDFFIKRYYSDQEYLKYKETYLLLAVDGTSFDLPYEPELIETFHTFDNGQGQPICKAQSVKFYDLLNHLTLTSSFAPYNAGEGKGQSEQALFDQGIEKLPELIDNQLHSILLVGDIYYASFFYAHHLPQLGYDFLFRCTPTFCNEVKAFAKSGLKDTVLEIDLSIKHRKYSKSVKRMGESKPEILKIRCVKIPLPNGETEFLLTNITSNKLSVEELGEIYDLRWGEEVSFDTDKNIIEIENFASKSPNGVRQEFYGKTLTCNIAELLIADAQKELDEIQKSKNNKHQYKINRATTIGLVKDEIVFFFTAKEAIETWYPRMLKEILRHRVPIRPGRFFSKKRKHKLKFSMNKRRVT